MQIENLVMVVSENPTAARPAQGRGGAARRADTNRRGYPPMSKGAGLARAGKMTYTLPKIFSSPTERALQPVSPSAPYPIIPLADPDDEERYLPPMPTGFSANPMAMALALAPKKFGKKILDEASAARLAQRLVQYFSRPLHGTYEETVFYADGTQQTRTKPYNAPLPLLTEFANMNGMTEQELKEAAKEFSDMARALAFAKDVIKTSLVRKGLEGDYNPQVTVFTATNETDMKVKTEHTERTLNVNDLLDRIERASQPIRSDV